MLGSILRQENQATEISFYTELQAEKLNYEAFKDLAQNRFQILKQVESNKGYLPTIKSLAEDLNSHACLKLICSQSKWSTTWFISNEGQLFRNRLDKDLTITRKFFIERFWPHIRLNSAERIDAQSCFDIEHKNRTQYLQGMKLHFSKCSSILSKREYPIKKGYLCTNDEILKAWMVTEFKNSLAVKMDCLNAQLVLNPDERLGKLVFEIFRERTAPSKAVVDALSKESRFPLCIKGLIDKFKELHHLKYNDRQALALFFKDVGVPLQETIHFFSTHFNLPLDEFNKKYLYNIRHNYGLEGKRANYGSYSCSKLAGLSNDVNSFGCPFVRNQAYVSKFCDIEDLGGDYHQNCAKVGSAIAGKELGGPFLTPAEYFRLLEHHPADEDERDAKK